VGVQITPGSVRAVHVTRRHTIRMISASNHTGRMTTNHPPGRHPRGEMFENVIVGVADLEEPRLEAA
jgi:hypothetical protein